MTKAQIRKAAQAHLLRFKLRVEPNGLSEKRPDGELRLMGSDQYGNAYWLNETTPGIHRRQPGGFWEMTTVGAEQFDRICRHHGFRSYPGRMVMKRVA
jgi:hypothetical protein